MPLYDWIIKSGRLVDPATGIDGQRDVALVDGRIAAVEVNLEPSAASHIYDARGQIVTPGLIDIHIHGYHLATPLGIDVDHHCLGRGVTTAVDAGSAGCDTFPGFRAFAVERSRTRLLAYLNVSRAGLSFASVAGGDIAGELETLKLVDAEDCASCIDANRDLCVGVKVRLTDSIADAGRNEAESYRRALAAARATGLPLMVHHSFSTVSLDDCPGLMARGDVYTHCFHGFRSTIIAADGKTVHSAVLAAREKGVLFDIGHGMGAFSWAAAEASVAAGFLPDIISTDLHSLCHEGPAYDLVSVMTKLLAVGMPLADVIRATTTTAAAAIGWDDRIGSLQVGREADVAVLALEPVATQLEDCQGQLRHVDQRLRARAVWRAGVPAAMTEPLAWPNPANAVGRDSWHRLEVRDATRPVPVA
jgi:dihydroorotase